MGVLVNWSGCAAIVCGSVESPVVLYWFNLSSFLPTSLVSVPETWRQLARLGLQQRMLALPPVQERSGECGTCNKIVMYQMR